LHGVAGALPEELAARAPGVLEAIQALRAGALRRSVEAALEAEAPEVRARVELVELPPTGAGEGGGIRAAVVEALRSGGLPEPALRSAIQRLEQAEAAAALDEPLDPLLPLDRQPLLAEQLRMAEIAVLGQAAGLADDTVAAVIAEVSTPAALDDAAMERLVAAGTLSADQAAELGVTTSLFNLLDADVQLAQAVRQRIRSVRDLATLTADEWRATLRVAAIEPPAGMTLDGYADTLGAKVAAAFPSDAFLARVVPLDMGALQARLATRSIEELRVVARSYPGLDLAEIVEDPGLTGGERTQRIVGRIGLLARVRTANPDVELLALDYSPGSPDLDALQTPDLSGEDRGRIIGTLKAYQRVHTLGQDPSVSAALVEAGYLSATAIVRDGMEALINASGLGKADAQRVYDNATTTFEGVTASLGTVLDLASGGTDWAAVANLGPSAEAYLRRLDGYATLFGSQTACRCEHCQSILSPAAYFVDLMSFVERQVLQPVFTGPRANSQLHLRARRPDLWTLPLTCTNTTTPIPTLEIVNQVLEDRVARDGGFAGALTDRAAVERAVYRDALRVALNSFRQPFWLPLERLETYLDHFEETRASVARVLGAPAFLQTMAALGVSPPEADLLAQGDATADLLRRVYGMAFEIAAGGAVTAFDAQRLLAPMDVTRDELGMLLGTRYVRAGGPAIQIRAEKTTPDSVQNDIERIYGVTAAALDRLHRLTRLWRRLPWSIGELDLLITQVGGALSGAALERLTTVRQLQERLELPVEELCGLFGDLPSQPITSGGTAFIDRRFNTSAIRGAGGALPDPALRFLHPAFRADPTADGAAPLQQRLLAGLAVTDEILHQLIVELARPLGVDLDAAQEDQKGFALSAGNLALLYRHARLAERLRLSIPELFLLLEHAGSTAPTPVTTALIHYRRPAGDYDDPARGSWGVHLWGDGLAPGVATTWDAPRPRARVDAYGAVFEVPLADPTRPVHFAIHLPGQDTVPAGREPGGDQAFVPAQQREVWLRQSNPTVAHAPCVTGLDDLVALLEVDAWRRESGYPLDDLGRITGGRVVDGSTAPDPAKLVADIVAGAAADRALEFADTVFAFLPGVTEQYSRDIVAANTAAIVVSADGTRCRLDDAFDAATALTVPAPAAAPPPGAPAVGAADLRAVLLRYHASEVVPSRLAAQLGFPVAKTRALLGLAGVGLSGAPLATALRGAGGLDPLTTVLHAVLPLAALFAPAAFDADAVAFVGANPALFGIADVRRIDAGAVRRLSRYAALVAARDAGFSTATEPVASADVRAVLLAFTPAAGFSTVPVALLARALRVEPGLAATIRAAVPVPANAPEALDKLARCAALARRLGVGGDALATLVAEDYDALQRAAEAVLNALRARYPEEAQLASRLEPLEDRLRSRRRDALVEQLTRAPGARFAAASELYHHFLIDVELEGCARTTRVAAAIGAVQLYAHRILLNLEQDERDVADPAHVYVEPSRILEADEWTWRRNYRVWEANRKVFLNPEYYLEPELRDDKTPLYEALEADLLQQDITDENVLAAYTNYMAGFDEVANLAIAGVYHDVDRALGGGDVMHLFGATSSDPPTYYYRSVENLYHGVVDHRRGTVWHPWRKLDIQVPDRLVAPVVFLGRLHLFWTQVTTRPTIEIVDGASRFTGYQHRLSLRYTTLRPDGSWTAPQIVALDEAFPYSRDVGRIEDRLITGGPNNVRFPRLDPAQQAHEEPRDSYTLRGPNWGVYLQPNASGSRLRPGPYLNLMGRDFSMVGTVDLFRRKLKLDAFSWVPDSAATPYLLERQVGGGRRLYFGFPAAIPPANLNGFANLIIEDERIQTFISDTTTSGKEVLLPLDTREQIAALGADDDLMAVNGSPHDAIVQTTRDAFLIQRSTQQGVAYDLRRFGTTLSEALAERLFVEGVDGLVATEHQLSLQEARAPVTPVGTRLTPRLQTDGIDFTGPYGAYYREVFFHIPFQIACHLNGQQRFAAAQRWFHYIFNPTAAAATRDPLSGIAATAGGDGSLHLCGVEPDGGLGHSRQRRDGTWDADFEDVKAATTNPGVVRGAGCGADAAGVLHVCAITADGGMWHTLREADGAWQPYFGDVKAATSDPGRFQSVTCAAEPGGTLHVCGSTTDSGVWHTLRRPDGSWAPVFGDVKSAVGSDVGAFLAIGCGVDSADTLHLCGVDPDGWLLHTLRRPDGSWQQEFDVVASGDPGLFRAVACAGDRNEMLHICGITTDGRLWHRILHPDGWTDFEDVKAVVGGDPGAFSALGCAVNADGALELFGVTTDRRLWQTTRRADGSWSAFALGAENERDRSWRYSEFRGLSLPKLREILGDPRAIEVYRTDPFNPHAIARLRLTAYQKAVVMKYLGNLMDWGDSLFTEFTAESVNEATLLYVMVADILGERPVELGECGEAVAAPRDYATIAPLLVQGSEFLLELETTLIAKGPLRRVKLGGGAVLSATTVATALQEVPATANGHVRSRVFKGIGRPPTRIGTWRSIDSGATTAGGDAVAIAEHADAAGGARIVAFGKSLASQVSPVFCIPTNRELRGYWDRVEDRLLKIRNCQDITGARRELAIFAPEIDPRVLVRARAAGLSLEDALGATSGNLPPYRFSFLIDRAKAHAATVQGFGAALLSTLERKDVEELTRLRAVHQQNLLAMATRSRQDEIDAAHDAVETIERQKQAAEYRRDFYQGLATQRLNTSESQQLEMRNLASEHQANAGTLATLAGTIHLVPQLGAPTALKYGGKELGDSFARFAGVLRDLASVAEARGAASGLRAGFDRRVEGWEHQVELAKHDIAVLDKQLEGAKVRERIATASQAIHLRAIEQEETMFELLGSKFSSLGLYTHLARSLQRLLREAYNGAYAMARLAEQAYRLERDDQAGELLSPSYWDASHAGLLAGERLLVDLQAMERRFLETNYRGLEVDQAFSLTQIDPAALVELRETGSCEFTIPELFYDLFYPGHYRRQIKAVRLTIPCVTGPYTNVSATLTLRGSRLRRDPEIGRDAILEVPLRRSVSIATSTAQQDAGVFELSFRDERYMPFEKAGAISDWRLSLPRTFKPFDYRTITDVILHVTYTAEADAGLREVVEDQNDTVIGSLRKLLTDNSLRRVFSLRSDFSAAFSRLLHSPPDTSVRFELASQHLPLFLPGDELEATAAKVALVPADGQALGAVSLRLDAGALGGFTDDASLGGLPTSSATNALVPDFLGEHILTVVDAGDLGIDQPAVGDVSALDAGKLRDVLIVVDYKLKKKRSPKPA
jgi:hypothetical protein